LQKLLSGLSQLSGVETSELDTVWIERLYGFIQLGQRMTYGLICLFAVGLALVVGNTMRMVTQNHQQAIKVLKLVGATQTFIRRPLLYQGALYGLFGGAIACLLVTILFAWLQAPAQHLVASYHSLWHLQGLSWMITLRIIEWCALLGLAGSWLSTRYYLRLPEQV